MITLEQMLCYDEGKRTRAYRDSNGNVTVGVGFNLDNIYSHRIWNQAVIPESFTDVYNGKAALSDDSIESLLNLCIHNAILDLTALFSNYSTFPEGPKLALVNLMFNMGRPVFQQFNTTIELIKEGKYADAGQHILSTKWAKELPARAKRVAALFAGSDKLYDI